MCRKKTDMSGKISSSFQPKKAGRKGILGKVAGGLVKQGRLSIKPTVNGDPRRGYAVELWLAGDVKRKKFLCEDDEVDDVGACTRAYRFAAATVEVPRFCSFLIDERWGCEDGSSMDCDRSSTLTVCVRNTSSSDGVDAMGDQFPSAAMAHGGLKHRELHETPVSYICLRQNSRLGLVFVVVMTQVENRLRRCRTISFQMQRRYTTKDDDYSTGEEELFNRATAFLRSVAFEDWRKQGTSRSFFQGDQSGAQRHINRGLKHQFSSFGIENGEKVDCSCGKNRSKGLMVACEQCGVWEHAECLGYKSKSQIPEDYVCSACIRAQKEEVVYIRLDEQGTGQIQCSRYLLSDPKEREILRNEAACCVCGCEDNEEFESMIHSCLCGDTLALAHPHCLSSASETAIWKERAKLGTTSSSCPVCGGKGFVSSGNNGAPPSSELGSEKCPLKHTVVKRNTRRPTTSEHSLKGVKRLQAALSETGAEKNTELMESLPNCLKEDAESFSGKKADNLLAESIKSEATVLGRKFADAAVTVPIKKRRLQLMETIRSPSPPPRSPSPSHQSDITVLKDITTKELLGNLENEEWKNAQDIMESRSVFLEDERNIITSKMLGTEGTFSEGPPSDGKQGKPTIEESFISKEPVVAAAQMTPPKEVNGVVPESAETSKGIDEKPCSNFIIERGDAQRSQLATTNLFESPKFHSMCGESPLLSPKQETDTEYGMVENETRKNKNEQDICSKTKESSITNTPEVAHRTQGEMNNADGSLELSAMAKDEQQSVDNQSLEESNRSNVVVCNRDDRSHWDLNMEMEDWERPCASACDAGALLDKAEVCNPPNLDFGEAREVFPMEENEEVTHSNSDTKDSCLEDMQEKLTDASSIGLDDFPAPVSALLFMPSEMVRVDTDSSPAVVVGNPVFNSENYLLKSSLQKSVDQDGEAQDGSKTDINELTNASTIIDPCQEDLAYLEKGSYANAVASNAFKVEANTSIEMASGAHTAADTPDPVLPSLSSANVPIEATRQESVDNPQDDSVKGSYGFDTSKADLDPPPETGKKRKSMESEAFEEDEQVLVSPRSLHDSDEQVLVSPRSLHDSDGREDDNDGTLGEMRHSDWDGNLGDDIEAEDVDYGDSDHEDEQVNRDGGMYGLEADELASAGSQEEREFEDNEDDMGNDYEEQGPSLRWVDSPVYQTEEAGDRDQCTSDTDIAIPCSCEVDDLRTDQCQADQGGNVEALKSDVPVENSGSGQEGKGTGKNDQNTSYSSVSSKKTCSAARGKSSGWDQLPEGFEKAEDALRAVKENVIRGGRGVARGSFLSGAGGRGPPFLMDPHSPERGRTDVSARSRSSAGQSWDFGRGRSRGRIGSSGVLRERSRIDPWVNDAASGPPGQWAPKRHPSPPGRFREGPGFGQRRQANAAAIAAAKLESSGFVVAPDGTITRAGSAGSNALRGAHRPFPCGGRPGGGSSMYNSGRGSGAINEMSLGTRVGMSPGGPFGFGPGMRGNISMNTAGIRVGVSGRAGVGNRGMIERYRIPPRGAAHFVGEQSFLNRQVPEHPEKWNRRQRHLSPASLRFNRNSPPSRPLRRSRSRSRTRSPRLRTPPRSGNGGYESSGRQSRSPVLRSIMKGESRESSPGGHHSNAPPPKLPLPPPPPRGKRSPPAGLKRLSEKREGERKYTDLEPIRSTVQSHTSPRRLASHIEHANAVSDEPNEPVSALRQSSVTDKQKSSISLAHVSRSGSNRDFGALESFGKPNSEVQHSSEDDFKDAARKSELLSKEHRLKDVIWVDKADRDPRADADFHRRKLRRDDSRRENFKSGRAGRGGSDS